MNPRETQSRQLHIRAIDKLPPLSPVQQRLLTALNDDKIHIDELAELIEQDAGMMARIVGVANSAYFGFPGKIFTVREAIMKVLGLNMVKSLAYSITLSAPMRSSRCPGFSLEQYWYVSVVTATASKRFAQITGVTEESGGPDMAYLCGLLHTLGILVLVHSFPDELCAAVEDVGLWDAQAVLEREQDALGLTHAEAGATLGRKWHLPEPVVTAMEQAHRPDYRGPHQQLCALAGLASCYAGADVRGAGVSGHGPYLARLEMDEGQADTAFDQVRNKKAQLAELAKLLALD